MLVTACEKPWDKDSISFLIEDNSHYMLFFTAGIFASNFKESKLLTGGVLCGKTVPLGKISRDGVWRFEIICL